MKLKRDVIKKTKTLRNILIGIGIMFGLLYIYIDRALVRELELRGVIGEVVAFVIATILMVVIVKIGSFILIFIAAFITEYEEVEHET